MRLAVFSILLILLLGCTQPDAANQSVNDSVADDNGSMMVGGDKDEHGCIGSAGYTWCETKQKCIRQWEEPCEGKLNITQAMAIAEGSECARDGSLTNTASYNNVTDTWWIDLEPKEPKQGCSPACVVYEKNGTAQVNWRCTGLVTK